MEYKITRKAIVNGGANIKCAGFGDLWYLLSNHERLQGIEEYEHKAQSAGTPEQLLQEFCKLNGGAV